MSRLSVAIFALLLAAGCHSNPNRRAATTTKSGVAIIAVDDCYANIVQAAVNVYEGTHREAFLLPLYVGEKEAVELLLRDSVRLAILARKLT
ncbi:MAG: phosphate ABC transporter substrate-binding protein, partial [Prevotellaceae bacterium]|nr:phosphate ABC transporter substrate-binding protein [Prevotellaceae bacterium]